MEPLWSPSEQWIQETNLTRYTEWLASTHNKKFKSYHELWQWSTDHLDEFWKSLIGYFDVLFDGDIVQVISNDPMPKARWFEGIKLNYAEHVFRKATNRHPAIIYKSENEPIQEISWKELIDSVTTLQGFLKSKGVVAGDCVVAYLPCTPEATIAFLAANSLGAIWSSCSPDFGTQAVVDRFAQIKPKVLIATDEYTYGGKTYSKETTLQELIHQLPTLEQVIVVSSSSHELESSTPVTLWHEVTLAESYQLEFTRVPFSHPMWVLYSSGTTGLPKAITHSQGGILLEQLKYGTFHNDFKTGDRCFWYTTTGWMMWNYIHGSLLAGGSMVLYDGSPGHPDLGALWKFSADAKVAHFGTSAGFILACMKAEVRPDQQKLSSLRSISSTGSTLPPEGFDWIYHRVKKDVWLASMSGGTDVCSAFVGGNPTLPVYPGEIQCRALGCALEAFDENGKGISEEVGEMVITKPMPSMPIYFWNDPDFTRYTESYFEMYPAIWRHGDWIKITSRQGIVIYGRSDATLNRGGVRIGTSEIYRAVDKVDEVKDSLIICIEKEGGEFWMPLFVILKNNVSLTDEIKKKINSTIRADYSPRHVPDEIIAVPDIPYTISGKKTETPVKKVLMGKDPNEVVNTGALRNPESMDFFTRLANNLG